MLQSQPSQNHRLVLAKLSYSRLQTASGGGTRLISNNQRKSRSSSVCLHYCQKTDFWQHNWWGNLFFDFRAGGNKFKWLSTKRFFVCFGQQWLWL